MVESPSGIAVGQCSRTGTNQTLGKVAGGIADALAVIPPCHLLVLDFEDGLLTILTLYGEIIRVVRAKAVFAGKYNGVAPSFCFLGIIRRIA